MADIYPSKLQLWDGGQTDYAEAPALSAGAARSFPPPRDEKLDRWLLQETFLTKPRRKETADPLSLDWFLEIEGLRHGRYGRWVPRLLEFGKHAGERLLGIGPGLGTDWVQYARQGAEVVACSPSAEQIALVQRNFELRGLQARFLHADPTVLPLETASIDVVCVGSFLENLPAPAAVVQEIYRVLKPGGKVLALAPAAYNVEFWCRRWLPWRRSPSAAQRPPAVTGRAFRQLFENFVELRVSKRQLRRGDVPHVLRWFPPSVLERIMGRFLVLKAFKPLHATSATPIAA